MMKKLWFGALFLVYFLNFAPSYAQNSIGFPEGEFRDTNGKDFSAKNLSSDYYNELWTYHINLENGVQIIYSFSINDFGTFKDRVTGGKLIVSWTNGKNYVVNKQYGMDDLIIEPENRFLRLHPNRPYWAKGSFDKEHTLNFKTTKDGVSYDLNLKLTNIIQGKAIGDGIYQVDGNKIGLLLLMPHADVDGYVEINGERIQARGTAYMDHLFVNNASSKVINKSYRVKSGDHENGFFFHFITLKNGGKNIPIGYGVQYQNGRPNLLSPSKIDIKETINVRDVKLENELMVKPFQMNTLNLSIDKHLHTYSMMDELSGFQKFFAKRVIGGELIEMNGTLKINENMNGFFYYLATD